MEMNYKVKKKIIIISISFFIILLSILGIIYITNTREFNYESEKYYYEEKDDKITLYEKVSNDVIEPDIQKFRIIDNMLYIVGDYYTVINTKSNEYYQYNYSKYLPKKYKKVFENIKLYKRR